MSMKLAGAARGNSPLDSNYLHIEQLFTSFLYVPGLLWLFSTIFPKFHFKYEVSIRSPIT